MQVHFAHPYPTIITLLAITGLYAVNAHGDAQIFRCVVDDVVTFSDRPCAADAVQHLPNDQWVSTVKVEQTASGVRSVPPVSRLRKSSGRSIAADQAKHKENCARIERSLRDMRSQMRAGYDAKQGERLRERQRRLNDERREKRC